jgi:hypothetical protein
VIALNEQVRWNSNQNAQNAQNAAIEGYLVARPRILIENMHF